MADSRPLYQQLVEQIRRKIAVGEWKPGDEIPSIRAVAASTQVSMITVKRAYSDLEHEGLIVTRHGMGSFVSEKVNLSTQLREQELEEHIQQLAELSVLLDVKVRDLASRISAARAKLTEDDSQGG